AECIFECERSQWIERVHLDYIVPIAQKTFSCGASSLRAVVKLHLRLVARKVMPTNAVKSIEEIVQLKVVQDDYAGVTKAYFPDRAMMQRVVAYVVDSHVTAIEFSPRQALNPVMTDFRVIPQVSAPLLLIRPQRHLRVRAKSRQHSNGELRYVGWSRWQWREPVQFHASNLRTTFAQVMSMRS